MRKVVLSAFLSVLVSTALSSCVVGLLELQIVYGSPYVDIDVDIAYDMITNGSYPNLVVLDVRTQSEYDSGHIYGAVWIPNTELAARIGELAGHENHEIIVYCRSGVRSAAASGILDSHSFTKVYNMLGGIQAWQSAGYPVWIATVHNVNTTFNYDTIQAAIDAPQTSTGHTILVDAGTYYERLLISKSLEIIGENKSNTIIDGNIWVVIKITADSVKVSGFTVRNGGTSWLYTAGSAILLYYAESCCISDIIVLNSRYGITSYFGRNNTISDNIISDTNQGTPLYYSSNETVIGNVILNGVQVESDPPYGVQVYGSASNTVIGNTVTNISYTGIRLTYATENIVSENIVSNTSVGISASHESFSNTITGNTASKNDIGVEVWNSNNNTVIGNTVVLSNVYGVYLEESNGTILYHNNFVNNTQQLYTYASYETVWDNGCEGNYWSDYTGVDTDGDGVGDTLLPHQGVDYYPLMNPYILGDANHDAIVDIFDLVLVALAYGSTPIDPDWNPHADLNGDCVIDIFDLVIIAINYGKTWSE